MLFLSLILIVGLILLIVGAEVVVRTSGSLARFWGVSEFVIGMIIIGFGTSLPELVVSLMGAYQSNSELCVGNVIGSNIYNLLLILGLSVLISPISVTRSASAVDLPFLLLITFLAAVFGVTGMLLSRAEGCVLLAVFVFYMVYSFRSCRQEALLSLPPSDSNRFCGRFVYQYSTRTRMGWMVKMLFVTLIGFVALLAGGRMSVYSAENLARSLGVSQRLVAILILAIGTSLPELVTSLVALRHDNHQLLLGNLIGSNIFNLLFILGLSSAIWPQSFAGISSWDVITMIVSAMLVCFMVLFSRHHSLRRWHGAVLFLLAVLYTAYLILT